MPLPHDIPDWVYPGNRILTRLAGPGRGGNGQWAIQAVEVREDGTQTGLHVRMVPPATAQGVLPGWFPIEWVLDNCRPAQATGPVEVQLPGEPREVDVSFDGGPPQRFAIVNVEVAATVRITLEQRSGQEDEPAPEEGVWNQPVPWLHPGRVLVVGSPEDTEEGLPTHTVEEIATVLRRQRWLIEEVWSDQPHNEPLVRIREMGTDGNNQDVQLAQNILENFTHTGMTAPVDGLPMLTSGAPVLYRQITETSQRFNDAFGRAIEPLMDVFERLAQSLSELVSSPGFEDAMRTAMQEHGEALFVLASRPPLPPPAPVRRRTSFERLLEEDDEEKRGGPEEDRAGGGEAVTQDP